MTSLVRISSQVMRQTRRKRTSMVRLTSKEVTRWNARIRLLSPMSRLSKSRLSICASSVARGSSWLLRNPQQRKQPPKARAKKVLEVRINRPRSSSKWHQRLSRSPPPSCLQWTNRSQEHPLLRQAQPRSNRVGILETPQTTRRRSPIPRLRSMLRWEM